MSSVPVPNESPRIDTRFPLTTPLPAPRSRQPREGSGNEAGLEAGTVGGGLGRNVAITFDGTIASAER